MIDRAVAFYRGKKTVAKVRLDNLGKRLWASVQLAVLAWRGSPDLQIEYNLPLLLVPELLNHRGRASHPLG